MNHRFIAQVFRVTDALLVDAALFISFGEMIIKDPIWRKIPCIDKTRQDFILTKYIILRPGTANSVANLGWPGDKIKKKYCCNYLQVKYTS